MYGTFTLPFTLPTCSGRGVRCGWVPGPWPWRGGLAGGGRMPGRCITDHPPSLVAAGCRRCHSHPRTPAQCGRPSRCSRRWRTGTATCGRGGGAGVITVQGGRAPRTGHASRLLLVHAGSCLSTHAAGEAWHWRWQLGWAAGAALAGCAAAQRDRQRMALHAWGSPAGGAHPSATAGRAPCQPIRPHATQVSTSIAAAPASPPGLPASQRPCPPGRPPRRGSPYIARQQASPGNATHPGLLHVGDALFGEVLERHSDELRIRPLAEHGTAADGRTAHRRAHGCAPGQAHAPGERGASEGSHWDQQAWSELRAAIDSRRCPGGRRAGLSERSVGSCRVVEQHGHHAHARHPGHPFALHALLNAP